MKSKKKVSAENTKRENTIIQSSSLSHELFKPKIRIVGVGGGGGSIVSEIGKSLHGVTFVIADTDIRSFKKRQGIKNFLFGQELTHGLGTGLNIDLAKRAAEMEKDRVAEFFNDQDIVIFVSCLGGGLGSGATQVFLDAAKDFSGITVGIFTLPFKFEGRSKYRIASKALKQLRKLLGVSITIPNEKIFKVIDENTAIIDAFSMVNKSLINSLESLVDLIQSPGLINIDFADLRSVLQGRGNLAFLNTAEASGKDRADIVIKNILHNPLYQDSFTPEKVLFNIEGGKNLSMFEVDKISKSISEQNTKAKIIFGISRNSKFKNKVKTTLLMTGSAPFLKNEIKSSKAKKAVVKKSSITKNKAAKPSRSKKVKKNRAAPKKESSSIFGNLIPSFSNVNSQKENAIKMSIGGKPENQNKTIRRTALEIKEAEVIEVNKKTKQEEEWDIPTFLRFKKVK